MIRILKYIRLFIDNFYMLRLQSKYKVLTVDTSKKLYTPRLTIKIETDYKTKNYKEDLYVGKPKFV